MWWPSMEAPTPVPGPAGTDRTSLLPLNSFTEQGTLP